MRKLIPLLLILLSSCASYTIQDGYDAIRLPEETGPKPETRYRLIQEARESGDDSYAIPEAEPVIIAEGRLEDASGEEEIPGFPEDLSTIAFPYLNTASTGEELKSGDIITATVLMLDFGFDPLSPEDIARITLSVKDIDPDFIILTGSLENQVSGAGASGMNAVLLSGGTVLYRCRLDGAGKDIARFTIAEGKDLGIAPVSQENGMPDSTDGMDLWLSSIRGSEEQDAEEVLSIAGRISDKEAVIALSSSAPSSADWTELTPYQYRRNSSFELSDKLLENGWKDAYAETHFSPGTDPGITAIRGDIYERMDFLYIKGMMADYAITFPVAGLTDTVGNLGLIAEFIIP